MKSPLTTSLRKQMKFAEHI